MQDTRDVTDSIDVSTSTIAYLAPEIPALSATFVYEEIRALEARGQKTKNFSVHKPKVVAEEQLDLFKRTCFLYEGGKARAAVSSLTSLRLNTFAYKAFEMLRQDLKDVGLLSAHGVALCFQFLIAFRLADLLEKAKCTHLHVHFAHTPTQIAMYACSIVNIPFTFVGHANDIFQRPLLLITKAQRAKKFITISEYNRDTLISLGIPKEQLAVVRCGVSFKVRLRHEAWTKNSTLNIGSIGRLIEKKGFDVLIKAVALLKRKKISVRLTIAGDGPLKQDLIELCNDLSVADCVNLIGDIPHSKVASWMSSLDMFVLACRKDRNGDMDGIPVVLMEAMAIGIPVISTKLSGIPELVIHGQTGLLVAANDIHDLAEKIETLMNSPLLADSLIAAAALQVTNEFDMSTNINRLMSHLKSS
jgi:colanic acid/amylovoran biosynthesis glycosyltransferase